jgi:hypothetical protein
MDKQLWWSYLLKYGQDNIHNTNEIFTWFRIHPKSKSIQDQEYFETETDLLRQSIFRQLRAPIILEEQLSPGYRPSIDLNWSILIKNSNKILATFGTFYAERHYVKNDLDTTSKLMSHVIRWKGLGLNVKEWKLLILSKILPIQITRWLKKIKN